MKDIEVTFAGVESKPYDGTFTIIYIPDQRQILEPGQKYRIRIKGLSFGTSPAKPTEPLDVIGMNLEGEPLIKRKIK